MSMQKSTITTATNSTKNKKGVSKMTRKRNSFAKIISCTVLAVMMILGAALPALAADAYSQGTNAADPATAAITKVFKIPVNTTAPEAAFTFSITPVGVNGGADTTGMPALGSNGSVTVSFEKEQEATFTDNGTQYLVAQSADILANLLKDGTPWVAGAGIYKYTVKEIRGSGIVLSADENVTEHDYYSEAEYEIEIWVEEDANGVLFPMYIVGYYKEGTADEYYPGTPGDGKLDPTPGTEVPGTPAEIGELYSQIVFTNKYWKTDGPTNPNADKNALEVTKQVTGNNPDFNAHYKFSVKVTTPELVGANNKTYNAYIVDKDGNYVKLSADENPNTASGTSAEPAAEYITFTSDAAQTVYLKHGDRLVFFELEVGAKVEAYETVEANARVKYSRTFSTAGDFIMPVGTTGEWGFPREDGDEGPHYTGEGAGANVATFYNNMSGNPPTGVSVDNLPFIVLIGAAVAGLAVFVVTKARRNSKYNA